MLNVIICLVGTSGSGKDAIARSLPFPRVVSNRTRPKRVGEINGDHGWFRSVEDFHKDKEQGIVLAETLYAGNYYWVTTDNLAPFLYQGQTMTYVVDANGVYTLKKALGDHAVRVISVFVDIPLSDLRKRMEMRGDKPDDIEKRIQRIGIDYEFAGEADFVVLNKNGLLAETVDKIEKFYSSLTFDRFML